MAKTEEKLASDLALPQLFKEAWSTQKKIESAELSGRDPRFKDAVNTAIDQLERATMLVNELDLFSSNETVDEIATTDLKYVLVPALLGDLVMQKMDDDRIDVLRRSQIYFIDYLRRCHDYSITTEVPPVLHTLAADSSEPRPPSQRKSMEQLSAERQAKIQRLKKEKELENKFDELNKLLSIAETRQVCDEELLRDHTLALLQLWAHKAQDKVGSVRQEMELLEGMASMKVGGVKGAGPPRETQRQPMKPFVITKDMMKDKVFGAGYPSLPSMTVEEFYEQKYKDAKASPTSQQQQPSLEEDEDRDETEEELRKARQFDDYKDDHRRGWGNKKNMG